MSIHNKIVYENIGKGLKITRGNKSMIRLNILFDDENKTMNKIR